MANLMFLPVSGFSSLKLLFTRRALQYSQDNEFLLPMDVEWFLVQKIQTGTYWRSFCQFYPNCTRPGKGKPWSLPCSGNHVNILRCLFGIRWCLQRHLEIKMLSSHLFKRTKVHPFPHGILQVCSKFTTKQTSRTGQFPLKQWLTFLQWEPQWELQKRTTNFILFSEPCSRQMQRPRKLTITIQLIISEFIPIWAHALECRPHVQTSVTAVALLLFAFINVWNFRKCHTILSWNIFQQATGTMMLCLDFGGTIWNLEWRKPPTSRLDPPVHVLLSASIIIPRGHSHLYVPIVFRQKSEHSSVPSKHSSTSTMGTCTLKLILGWSVKRFQLNNHQFYSQW